MNTATTGYKISEYTHFVNDIEYDMHRLGYERNTTAEAYLKTLTPLLILLAKELKDCPSGSTVDQVATHLELIAEDIKELPINR